MILHHGDLSDNLSSMCLVQRSVVLPIQPKKYELYSRMVYIQLTSKYTENINREIDQNTTFFFKVYGFAFFF